MRRQWTWLIALLALLVAGSRAPMRSIHDSMYGQPCELRPTSASSWPSEMVPGLSRTIAAMVGMIGVSTRSMRKELRFMAVGQGRRGGRGGADGS